MKLQRLYLKNYRVLRDLDIYFSPQTEHTLTRPPSYSLDFLVGVNGTGKSTVLRVLFDLMRKLERNAPVEYGFELEYDLGYGDFRRRVRLSNIPENLESEDLEFEQVSPVEDLNVWENDQPVQLSRSILPEMVVAFTTGSETAWKNLDETPPLDSSNPKALQDLSPLERAIRELPGKPPRSETLENSQFNEDSRLLLIQAHQLSLVTLCGLLTDLAESPEYPRLGDVLQGANIKATLGFSLKFRMTQGTTSQPDRDEVMRLAQLATRALCLGTDYLLVFDLTNPENSVAQTIIENFSSGLQLFKILARLEAAGEDGQPVLREVNIFLERSPSSDHPETEIEIEHPPLHLLEWLSDGERSFLGRMCLFTFLGATEALILLDEPEVHFNDFWKRRIVYLLDETLKERHSHVLITTHSSITLTDVPREDIIVLDRNANYTRRSFNPGIQTLAANPSDIMVHVFNAPYAAGERGIAYIKNVLSDLSNREPGERREGIEQLLDQVGPGYWNYRIRRELLALEQAPE